MATNKTANYGLNQWVKSDQVVMEDFNEDNRKIEAALLQGLRTIVGTYIGTGTTDTIHYEVGVRPKFMIVWTDHTLSGNTYQRFFMAVESGASFNFASSGGQTLMTDFVTFTDDGFTLNHAKFSSPGLGFNVLDKTQTYWILY